MEKDLVFIFDKITKTSYQLGEIQSGFNMSFVIDGTKDSSKIDVHSSNGEEIEPNTILFHRKTNTWWIVSSDKVDRYYNEKKFFYVHNLQIEGAIELLNARDLTDCGFNDNTYTISEFINRLFSLSNFDYSISFSSQINTTFLAKKVDFIKTFENYTLLSALREFLDAYNMCAKLSFLTVYDPITKKYTITNSILNIIPKTGDFSLETHFIDEFDDVKETKVISRESFGTCVVSNAENVISSKAKTYPSTGAVKTSATEFEIVAQNAVIRLPSKVYRGNWIKCVFKKSCVWAMLDAGLAGFTMLPNDLGIDPSNDKSIEDGIQKIIDRTRTECSSYGLLSSFFEPFLESFNANKDRIKRDIIASGIMTLYNGNNVNPITEEIIKGTNVPYLAYAYFYSKTSDSQHKVYRNYIFCDKDMKNTLPNDWQGIAWERGSNIISGFNGFEPVTGSQGKIGISTSNTDVGMYYPNQQTPVFFNFSNSVGSLTIKFYRESSDTEYTCHFRDTKWIVNYIPMSDLKLKIDNSRDKKDVHLYNQNGRLTDCIALSKLINSYSKEISSDKITRYAQYINFNDVPKVGSIVFVDNYHYVINNISLDFTQNENVIANEFNYFIDCEITMCKYISTKSLMVNPNTNIRDYVIPQNYNVKRKQLYRDYYELSYQPMLDANQDTPYLDPSKIFIFPQVAGDFDNFITTIKLTYDHQVENSYVWYYQLETTNYYLNKMVYVVLDFNDNNIIGYGSQNVFSGFDVSRIFRGMTDELNTPISYVDENGKVKGIDVLFCTNEQLTTIYEEYQAQQTGGDEYDGSLYNYSVFIPADIYNAALNNHSIYISEENYYKDATEVPVFEYVCQIDDSEDILIGDNILKQYAGYLYFYSFVVGENLTQNNVADTNTFIGITTPLGFRQNNSAEISYETYQDDRFIYIKIYNYTQYEIETGTFTNGQAGNFHNYLNKDIAIFRRAYNIQTAESYDDLILIAKKIKANISVDGTTLVLRINHYKLK